MRYVYICNLASRDRIHIPVPKGRSSPNRLDAGSFFDVDRGRPLEQRRSSLFACKKQGDHFSRLWVLVREQRFQLRFELISHGLMRIKDIRALAKQTLAQPDKHMTTVRQGIVDCCVFSRL